MTGWEDIDENERDDPEEEEEVIIDYCSVCGEPICDGDIYTETDDGSILCENCAAARADRY